MRFSLSTGSCYHRSLSYCLRLARDAGFDGVELALRPDLLLWGPAAARRASVRAGLPILSVHPPFYRFGVWPRDVRLSVPRLAHWTHGVGAQFFVLHAWHYITEDGHKAQWFAESLRAGQSVAGTPVGATIENMEYSWRGKTFILDDLHALVRMAQATGAGITFDTTHAGANGEDLLACYEIVRPVLRNVHLSDMLPGEPRPVRHVLPGEGVLPLAAFLAALARDGYDGLVTMEIHPQFLGMLGYQHNLRRLRGALEFARSAVGQPASTAAAAD